MPAPNIYSGVLGQTKMSKIALYPLSYSVIFQKTGRNHIQTNKKPSRLHNRISWIDLIVDTILFRISIYSNSSPLKKFNDAFVSDSTNSKFSSKTRTVGHPAPMYSFAKSLPSESANTGTRSSG